MRIKSSLKVLALTGAMAVGMAIPAFAVGYDGTPVYGTYSGEAGADVIISVGIQAPEEVSFTYSAGNKGTWNPTTHTYDGGSAEGKWSTTSSVEFTITNHSNSAITVTPTYEPESGYEDIKIGFTKPTFDLATAEGTNYAEAPSDTITAGVMDEESGVLEDGENHVKLGTINFDIAEKE